MSAPTTETKPGRLLAAAMAPKFAEASGDHVLALESTLRGFPVLALASVIDLVAHLDNADSASRDLGRLIADARDAKFELQQLGVVPPALDTAEARAAGEALEDARACVAALVERLRV